MSELTKLTASAAARAIAARDITSRALTDACLARIAAREPEIAAFAYIDPDHARRQADDAGRKLAALGYHVGPLTDWSAADLRFPPGHRSASSRRGRSTQCSS